MTFRGSTWDKFYLNILPLSMIPVEVFLLEASVETSHNSLIPTTENKSEIITVPNPVHDELQSSTESSSKSPNITEEHELKPSHAEYQSSSNTILPTKNFDSFILFNREKFIVKITNYLGILITFGVIFPLLAILLFISLWVYTFYEQIILTNFILNLKVFFHIQYSNAFRLRVKYIKHSFRRSLWILVGFATLIYAFIIFDTVGDQYGLNAAVIASCSLTGWALIIYCTFDRLWRLLIQNHNNNSGTNRVNSGTLGPSAEMLRLSQATMNP